MIFYSKIDTWLALVLLIAIVLMLLSPMIYTQTNPAIKLHQAIAMLALPIMLSMRFMVSTLCHTQYQIILKKSGQQSQVGSQAVLLISSGPFKTTILIDDIKSITPSKSLVAAPALINLS